MLLAVVSLLLLHEASLLRAATESELQRSYDLFFGCTTVTVTDDVCSRVCQRSFEIMQPSCAAPCVERGIVSEFLQKRV
jgi:hypothetical protein